MGPTEGFEAFVAIADHGSVSAAARVLGLPRATLSRQLARLEGGLGVRLAHRTSRRLTLTRAGELLYERARRILDDARAAHEDVARLDDVPRGVLRVSVPPDSEAFTPVLTSFLEAHPEVRLEVLATERFVDLVGEQVDVVIRGGPSTDGDLVGRVLATMQLICVASPAYLARAGIPSTAAELGEHQCIASLGDGPRTWPLIDGGTVEVAGRFSANTLITRLWAARLGHGITLVPDNFIRDDEARGALVRVLEDQVGATTHARVLYAERKHLAPKVRAFLDFLYAWTETHPMFEPGRVRP